jgi:hypothetical protein
MLSKADLALAVQLFEKLRSLTQPAAPEFVRDGQELADLLGVSRSKAYEITRRPEAQAEASGQGLGLVGSSGRNRKPRAEARGLSRPGAFPARRHAHPQQRQHR